MPRSKRRRSLILVDELAHTNVPGSRHPKRYQDVEELLDAGIDVYTTVNIQHIESLNDVVAQITRVRVREIVPDAILDRADAIELVDLTPDDLIQRLKEGKVYVPKQAERALKHYFSPANLTALRELALRRTAERVDEQLLEQMQARAIPGPWAAGERILVCVSEDPRSAGLVRHAKRLADRLHAPWTALTSRPGEACSSAKRRGTASPRPCASPNGSRARPSRMPAKARRIADDVWASRRKNNVTHIIIGKSTRSRWFEMLHGSVVHDLVRQAGNISVHVIAGEDAAPETPTTKVAPVATAAQPPSIRCPTLLPWLAVAAALGSQQAASAPLRARERRPDIPHCHRRNRCSLRTVAVARSPASPRRSATTSSSCRQSTPSRSPTRPTLPHSCCSRSLPWSSPIWPRADGSTALSPRERVRSVESLYAFSRKLAGAGTLDDVLWATAYQIASMLKVRVVLLLPENGSIALKAGYPPEDTLEEADLAAAKWAWEKNRPAGRDSDALPGAKWLFMPMRTGRGPIGILGICRDGPGALSARRAAAALGRAQRPGRLGDRAGPSR